MQWILSLTYSGLINDMYKYDNSRLIDLQAKEYFFSSVNIYKYMEKKFYSFWLFSVSFTGPTKHTVVEINPQMNFMNSLVKHRKCSRWHSLSLICLCLGMHIEHIKEVDAQFVSVADPWHIGTDPDPRNRTSELGLLDPDADPGGPKHTDPTDPDQDPATLLLAK